MSVNATSWLMAISKLEFDQSPPKRRGETGGAECEAALALGVAKEVSATSTPVMTMARIMMTAKR
jgi:hypothetical protein